MKHAVRMGVALVLAYALLAGSSPPSGPFNPVDAAATGSSAVTNLGAGGWQVQSSAVATDDGERISMPGFATAGWLSVHNDDAGAPGTEIGALLQNGACPDVFLSTNMKSCFGFMGKIGPVTVDRFAVPWWFRTDFTAPLRPGQHAKLVVNGVVGKADVWVNSRQVAGADTVTGAYTRFAFDVTDLLAAANTVAIRVHPNNPGAMFTVDNVEWNQIPPDNNTGIQFPVQLEVGAALSVGDAHVVQDTAVDLSRSALTVKTDVTNNTATSQTGVVTATVTPPGDGEPPITVSQAVTVPARTTRTLAFTPERYQRLGIVHPQIWWPYQMGDQPLYRLTTSVSQHGEVAGRTSGTFGIRTVTSYLTGASPQAPEGVRAFTVNGRPFVVRGGGFVPDLFLRYSAADTAKQIALMKSLGINTIRLEGHFMPEDFYRQIDRAGILINAGYQCCDRWQLPEDGGGVSAEEYEILRLSALTIGRSLRNHPSVFSFQWSDNEPTPEQERVSVLGLRQADFAEPVIASAEYRSTPTLGQAGEKEGPYDWVPPEYWYDTEHFDPRDRTRTNAGGAWGFASEQSAGPTVPTLDSIRRFLSAQDQADLWQNPKANQYHANHQPGTAGYQFGTLFHFDAALSNRYGPWDSLESYVQLAQAQNYENTRAQFEAFIAHSTDPDTPSTGTIYWQLNKGWPSLLWQLYNADGDQAGSYFGAQKANKPLHALYALDGGTVAVDNLGPSRVDGLSVQSKVYDLAGNVVDDQHSDAVTLASQQVATNVLTPQVPATGVYFVELLLKRGGAVVDRNVYWLSGQRDVIDWPATVGQPRAAMARYADLRALRDLPEATVTATATTRRQPRSDGADLATTVTITNTSTTPTVGFFLRADVRRGNPDGTELPGDNELQSSIWDNNDVVLWPGESETLTVTYHASDLHGATPVISVDGWNAAKIDIAAPAR